MGLKAAKLTDEKNNFLTKQDKIDLIEKMNKDKIDLIKCPPDCAFA